MYIKSENNKKKPLKKQKHQSTTSLQVKIYKSDPKYKANKQQITGNLPKTLIQNKSKKKQFQNTVHNILNL